jgi:hypothetical protein
MSHVLSSTRQQQKAPDVVKVIKEHEVYAEQKHGTMEAIKRKSHSFPPDVAPRIRKLRPLVLKANQLDVRILPVLVPLRPTMVGE